MNHKPRQSYILRNLATRYQQLLSNMERTVYFVEDLACFQIFFFINQTVLCHANVVIYVPHCVIVVNVINVDAI